MRTLGVFLILAALCPGSQVAVAGDGCGGDPNCCARCGRHAACQPKVCQLQCGVKKEKKHYWCVECEEFCTLLPGPREKCGCGRCDESCSGDCCDHCGKKYRTPKCGRPKCVQKLVKKEYDVEVPEYKCVVAYLCCNCCDDRSEPAAAPQVAPAAPPPAPMPSPPAPKAPAAPKPQAKTKPVSLQSPVSPSR